MLGEELAGTTLVQLRMRYGFDEEFFFFLPLIRALLVSSSLETKRCRSSLFPSSCGRETIGKSVIYREVQNGRKVRRLLFIVIPTIRQFVPARMFSFESLSPGAGLLRTPLSDTSGW